MIGWKGISMSGSLIFGIAIFGVFRWLSQLGIATIVRESSI